MSTPDAFHVCPRCGSTWHIIDKLTNGQGPVELQTVKCRGGHKYAATREVVSDDGQRSYVLAGLLVDYIDEWGQPVA